MSNVIGMSAFGLNDYVFPSPTELASEFIPSFVLLPDHHLGIIQTGEFAQNHRLHSGIYWPETARVIKNMPLRRVPVSLLWARFVAARETIGRWDSGNGISFLLSDMLASHISNLLLSIKQKQDSIDPIITIPNHLDEYAQEQLLRSLQSKGHKVKLLWRPVAAALSWLKELNPEQFSEDDSMIVIYAGVDAFEITSFSIQKQVYEGQEYLLPLRNRPHSVIPYSGLDWAFTLATMIDPLCQSDDGALWQAVFRFPEIWQTIAGRLGISLPRPWSTSQGWKIWKPALSSSPFECFVDRNKWLIALGLKEPTQENNAQDWGEFISYAIKNKVQITKQLRGIVLCGPLISDALVAIVEKFTHGLAVNSIPKIDSIWMPPENRDCISEGASLYGERLQNDLPTYLDTLPALKLMYKSLRNKFEWADIVAEATCQGGKEYKNEIKGRFILLKQQDKLTVYLQKEKEKVDTSKSLYRRATIPFPESPERDIRLLVDVSMHPSSGQAKVTFYSEDEAFLHGRGIPFDFARMEPFDELPNPPGLTYPEEMTMQITSQNDFWCRDKRIYKFLSWQPGMVMTNFRAFSSDLDKLKDLLYAKIYETYSSPYGIKANCFKINEKGETGSELGDKTVQSIADKISKISPIVLSGYPHTASIQSFITRVTHLWRATPTKVSEYIYNLLLHMIKNKQYNIPYTNYIIEAASRCLSEKEHIKAYFEFILQSEKMTIIQARSIVRLLNYYGPSKDCLTNDFANYLVGEAIKIIENEVDANNIKQKFFAGVGLFLMALKHRSNNDNFMNPHNPQEKYGFDKMKQLLNQAKQINFAKKGDINNLLLGVESFMEGSGAEGIIGGIIKEAGRGGPH